MTGENKKHPLFESMDEAKYFLMKSPNMHCLKLAIKKNEWILSKKAG